MIDHLTMKFIYKKLGKLGYSKSRIRNHHLPGWWRKELNKSPAAVLEAARYIASQHNIDLQSLISSVEQARYLPQDNEE